MQTLNQDIRSRSFRPVYLLYGEEAFLKNSYRKQLRDAIVGDDTMNFTSFSGKNPDVDEIIRIADTMPFFADRRMVLVEDSGFFKSAQDELVKYLPTMPETTCLVFVESEVDRRSRMYKKVKELGYAAEMKRQNTAQLSRWAGGILSKEGRKITVRTMDFFLGLVGDDMEKIRMELEKLISYTYGRDVVTEEDVRTVCTVQVNDKIFDMVAAIANRQPKKAMELYEDLLTAKEPPMRILFLIARQFNQILQVKEMMGEGCDKGTIAAKLKLQPFVVGRTISQAKQFSGEQILSYVQTCVDTEEAVKTGRLQDRLAVELLITKKYG